MIELKKVSQEDQDLEDEVTHLLSEWLNDAAPLGEEAYRLPARAVIDRVKKALRKKSPERTVRTDG